ncbi:MAG: FKBP-type peptidyl-prolyl cis-trans isomerase [Alistipes sp.]|nr:FKBP-type peptidyl-prolyl cis-trans isomerase [Alistipes sp.]
MKRAFFVVAAFVAMTISTAFSGGSQPQTFIDSLSYCIGADMGLNINFGVKELNIEKGDVVASLKDFLANGNVESEEFMEEMQQLQTFQYTKFMSYMQALENEQYDAIPELYDEQFKREDIARYLGHSMAASIKGADMELNMSFFDKGMEDALKAESPEPESINKVLCITLDEMEQVFTSYREELEANAQAKLNDNKEACEEWLAEVEQMEGVIKTESGLLYRIDRVGNGAQPTQDSDVVLVHYVGKNCHGEVFDSSYERGESISFALYQAIKGWTEGMKYVRAGGQITLWIPAELAYGDQERGELIPPGSALEFKVELLDVNPR